jgi:DNA-binding beta-propeller fold protein YncE
MNALSRQRALIGVLFVCVAGVLLFGGTASAAALRLSRKAGIDPFIQQGPKLAPGDGQVGSGVALSRDGNTASIPAYASHLYMTDYSSTRVFPFSFAADGTLTPISCPGSDCSGSDHSEGVAVSPNGQFLYATSVGANTVSPFAIAADGSLTPIACSGSDCSSNGQTARGVAVSPNGRFLYVTNITNPGFSPGSVSPFAIAADGSLTPIACSGSNCATGVGPRGVAVSPNGRFLYVANAYSVSPFAIAANGSLTPIACSGSDCATGPIATALTVSPNGRFLYAVNEAAGTVSPLAIGSDGSLTPIACTGSNCDVACCSSAITVSPNGRFLYVAGGDNSGNVSVSAIAADGSLTPVPCPGTDCMAGSNPGGVVVSPSGRFLYMASGYGAAYGTISVFAIRADGLLSGVSCPGSNCRAPDAAPIFQSLAISPDQAPTAEFSAGPASPGKPTVFDGSGSTAAPGQSVARYDWNFGDGTSAANAGPRPTHVYKAVGQYKVTLTVTDDAGCSTTLVFTGQTASCNGGPTAIKTLTVRVAQLPTIHITAPAAGARYIVGQMVRARFRCSDGTGGTGIASCTGTVANGGRLDTSRPGAHTFTVVATSNDGLSSSATAHYTVVVPSNRFAVTHLKVRTNGNVEFDVTVPYAGQLDVLETNWVPSPPGMHTVLLKPGPHRYAFARRHLDLARAGTMHISITPSARGAGQVRHHYRRVRINLWVTYQPNAGRPRTIGFISLFVTK